MVRKIKPVLMSVLCSLTISTTTSYAVKYEVKVDDALILRQAPSASSRYLTSLSNGTQVEVLEQRDNWGRINYCGMSGWICMRYVSLVQDDIKYTVNVDDCLMVRSGPGVQNRALSSLKGGTVVTVMQTEKNWGKITYGGITGWVCTDYLSSVDTAETVKPVLAGMSMVTQEYRGNQHKGVDIGSYGGKNIDVFAVLEGEVLDASSNGAYNGGMGNYVIIKHSNGYVTKYMHFESVLVKKGDFVGTGQRIGIMGSTGDSTGVHLHFQVEKNGRHVDPKMFVNPVC